MPDLNKLTLNDLIALRGALLTLAEAGKVLEMQMPGVTFDLTPGQDVRVHVPYLMPRLTGAAQPVGAIAPLDEQIRRRIQEQQVAMLAAQEDEPPSPAPSPAPMFQSAPRPAQERRLAGLDVKAFVDQVMREVDGAEAVPAPEPAPEPAAPAPECAAEPEAAPAPEAIAPNAPFSADEDQVILMQMKAAMDAGQSKAAGIRAAAAQLGRSEKSVNARFYGTLAKSPAPPPEMPAPAKPARPVPAELAEVAAHLRQVTPFGKWTPGLDRRLIELAEDARWPLHEICLELEISTAQAQQRFSTLTKAQAFKRAQIWAAMQAMGYGAEVV